MSIIRVGLAETKNFSDGYEAIFGKKKAAGPAKKKTAKAVKPAKAKSAAPKKKKTAKKK